jgi:hypothetical protein
MISGDNYFLVTRQFLMVYYSTVINGSHPPCFPPSGEGGTAFPVVFTRFYRLKTTVADCPSPKFGGGVGVGAKIRITKTQKT